jgi:hypothetical protein
MDPRMTLSMSRANGAIPLPIVRLALRCYHILVYSPVDYSAVLSVRLPLCLWVAPKLGSWFERGRGTHHLMIYLEGLTQFAWMYHLFQSDRA